MAQNFAMLLNIMDYGNKTDSEEGISQEWFRAAQIWAWTVAPIGGLGNFITILTIAYQLWLHHSFRKQRSVLLPTTVGRHSRSSSSASHSSASSIEEQNDEKFRVGAILSSTASFQQKTCPRCSLFYSQKRPVISSKADTLLLLHLSFCDLLYCSINLPVTALTYNVARNRVPDTSLIGTNPFCCGAAFFRYTNAFAEWMTLGLLTLQRCIDLRRPRADKLFTTKRAVILICMTWVISVLLQIPNVVMDSFVYNNRTKKCDLDENTKGGTAGLFYFYSLESLLPCTLMLFGCFRIIHQIWQNKRSLVRSGFTAEIVSQRTKEMWHSAAMLLGLLFLFLLCVLPICVYNVYNIFSCCKFPVEAGIAVYMTYWIQYAVNFLLYVVCNSKYRQAYKCFLLFVVKFVKLSVKSKKCECDHADSDNSKMVYETKVKLKDFRITVLRSNVGHSVTSSSDLNSPEIRISSKSIPPHMRLHSTSSNSSTTGFGPGVFHGAVKEAKL